MGDALKGGTASRRTLLSGVIAAAGLVAGQFVGLRSSRAGRITIRPPGALPEKDFLSRCTRCYQCGDICPNGAITFLPPKEGLAEAFTPVIEPRTQGCTACMKCTQVCPTGALQPVDPNPETVPGTIKMGMARLNKEMCYSWEEPARTCGVCYRACPFPGKAMTISLFERPTVNHELCIGCGLCEQSCIHLPQAIRILPVDRSQT